MAKFFNQRVHSKRRNLIYGAIITASIIGVIICFILVSSFADNASNTTIKIRDKVNIEIFGEMPDKEILFHELEGVDLKDIEVDYSKVDSTKLGEYTATIDIDGKEESIEIHVIDIKGPELEVQDYKIAKGDKYEIENFIFACEDNSKEECIITYLAESVDVEGEIIDYTAYTEEGSYEIKISATDSSGNQTIKSAILSIGDGIGTQTCSYGNLEYNTASILTYISGSNNCALDLNLYQNSSVRAPIDNIAENETKILQNEIEQLTDLTNNIAINRNITAILNNTGNGVVGFSLYIEAKDGDNKIIASFYLNLEGERIYIENPYELDK